MSASKSSNNPVVIIILCSILLGALAVTILRIKGADATNRVELAPRNETEQATKTDMEILDEYPVVKRDPFHHELLFAEQPAETSDDGFAVMGENEGNLPVLPFEITGIEPTSQPQNSVNEFLAVEEAVDAVDVEEETYEFPNLELQAIVSGEPPLAIIKDSIGKVHFVKKGERFGDGYSLISIQSGEAAVEYEGYQKILKIEKESEAHKNEN